MRFLLIPASDCSACVYLSTYQFFRDGENRIVSTAVMMMNVLMILI